MGPVARADGPQREGLLLRHPRVWFVRSGIAAEIGDRSEGIAVTNIYYGLCWTSLILAIVLLTVGLWNATLAPSEKGFYAMAYALGLFAAVAVQKNVRDLAASGAELPLQRDADSI